MDKQGGRAWGPRPGGHNPLQATDLSLRSPYTCHPGVVTLSAGVASYPADGETAAELVRVADTRLDAAKQGGRNRVIGPFG